MFTYTGVYEHLLISQFKMSKLQSYPLHSLFCSAQSLLEHMLNIYLEMSIQI